MKTPERFDLAEMLAEIELDKEMEAPEAPQHSDIPQSVITTLLQKRLSEKGSTTDE